MNPDFSILAHETLCAALFYSAFFRAVRSSVKVAIDVRLAFFGMGVVSCIGLVAPLVWEFVPSVFDLLLLAAIVIVQLVTARHWATSVPPHFCRPDHERRSTDMRKIQ